MGKGPQKTPQGPGAFDPNDAARIKHTRLGVWDFYEEKHPNIGPIPGASRLETASLMLQSSPYVWRMLKDICSIRRCLVLMILYLLVEVAASLVPAVSLWYSGQLLLLVETAVEKRTVDKNVLVHVAAGRVACTIIERLLNYSKFHLSHPLNLAIKRFYSTHMYHAMARLDVPTFEDPVIQRQLEAAWSASWGSSIAWDTIRMTSNILATAIRLSSQVSVLISVVSHQRDGTLLALLSFSQSLFQWFSIRGIVSSSQVWAATTTDEDYLRMQGYKHLVDNPIHRKEIVAGSLADHLTKLYKDAANHVGDNAGDFPEMRQAHSVQDRLTLMSILREPLRELPQIVFTLRAVQYPASIPVSIASLTLINHTAQTFSSSFFGLFGESHHLAERFASVQKLYEVANIQNRIVDGNISFPEDQQALRHGISIEFRRVLVCSIHKLTSHDPRNVSFRYPGSESYALRNISFKIGAGQLCVIVGVNGSGKSTILKLISRIYDPTEGTIFINDKDIKTLKLADLRRAVSILFQDYTHFPLSIKENIALGNPNLAPDDDKIREATRLGGAEEFIDKLPEGFDTYLDRPVRDYYSGLPEGTAMLFGRKVNYNRVRGAGAMRATDKSTLSGGQMQRLAVSRTFMRSLVSEAESPVGLLLFDEPSASLDPRAEHDLFERLRTLRGNKTMIFSSHRFGNLTRHSDLILYMDNAEIQEAGTHEALLARNGEYARVWQLQAEAFL
ncbi:P-loop containing nucleoside triphosphate hydrolase protein [Boletus edulis BED1]|uniref:P-loop containing nucleoside triphosphate hydrolase protein n=1 Tax=Boletus edulis BED1 TaxID=1328754 RepID=A0AAD4C269_BOLED|nr:P-loop containing nucleoside triphosphate hydrolase protein [Boletus edulis BED1]